MMQQGRHMQSGLELIDVVKRFNAQTVVDRASLDIAPGEIVALLGPSGCGKTTTLRMIAGFEKLDAGRIAIGGEDVSGTPVFQRRIGLVFQDYALFPHMTVAQNIDYGMRQFRVPTPERDNRRSELLRLVRLEGLDSRYPGTLSGGQQQRVALARALAISPNLLLLDEPLSNLDAKLRETLRNELREILRTIRMTTLVVTHDQQEAIGIADRIAVMHQGRIAQIGTAREIYEEPATRFVSEFIGHSLWFTGTLVDGPTPQFRSTDGHVFHVTTGNRGSSEAQGLAVRPEHIHLRARPDDANRIPATVERIVFFGADLIIHCKLKEGGRVIAIPARTDDPDLPAAGETIVLGIATARCRVVADA